MPKTQHRKSATPADFFSASKRIKVFGFAGDDWPAGEANAIGGVADDVMGGGVESIEFSVYG